MPRQAPLPKRTNIGVRRAQKCAKPCKMCTTQKAKTFLDAQASSTYKTHRNWSAKSPKMCTKKFTCLDGCPGKLHFQNPQNLECEEHKNVQNHAKCAQLKKQKLFWMPRQAPLTKRTEIGVQKAQKCAQKKLLVWMDAQASSTYKTHRTWSVKSTKICKTMQN